MPTVVYIELCGIHSNRPYVLRQERYLETLLRFIFSISSDLFPWEVVRVVLGALEETGTSAEAHPMLGQVVPPGRYSSPSAAAVATVGTARG